MRTFMQKYFVHCLIVYHIAVIVGTIRRASAGLLSDGPNPDNDAATNRNNMIVGVFVHGLVAVWLAAYIFHHRQSLLVKSQ
jgi:hypothetical protein